MLPMQLGSFGFWMMERQRDALSPCILSGRRGSYKFDGQVQSRDTCTGLPHITLAPDPHVTLAPCLLSFSSHDLT